MAVFYIWDYTGLVVSDAKQSELVSDVEQSHVVCHVEQRHVVSDIEHSYVDLMQNYPIYSLM